MAMSRPPAKQSMNKQWLLSGRDIALIAVGLFLALGFLAFPIIEGFFGRVVAAVVTLGIFVIYSLFRIENRTIEQALMHYLGYQARTRKMTRGGARIRKPVSYQRELVDEESDQEREQFAFSISLPANWKPTNMQLVTNVIGVGGFIIMVAFIFGPGGIEKIQNFANGVF